MRQPVVEVVPRRGARPVEPPSAPLPTAVLAALAAIVRDMRDVPRDCIHDPAELVTWLRRMAGRVEGVGRMRVPGTALPSLARPVSLPQPRPATPRDLAEAVFGAAPTTGKSQAVARRPTTRTITNRKGRAVSVETHRSYPATQLDMFSAM